MKDQRLQKTSAVTKDEPGSAPARQRAASTCSARSRRSKPPSSSRQEAHPAWQLWAEEGSKKIQNSNKKTLIPNQENDEEQYCRLFVGLTGSCINFWKVF